MPRTALAIALLAIAFRAAVAVGTRFTAEDYLITLRYAQNLAAGQGFVYNPGERVLGTTTPGYTLLLAHASSAGIPATPFGKSVNILADGLLCLVVYRWMILLGRGEAAWLASLWVAAHPLAIQWCVSGMETGLVTLFGALAWMFYAEDRPIAAYVCAAVMFLLRWDAALLAVVLTLALIHRHRRVPAAGLTVYAAIISPWLVWATFYFGSPIPGTAAAKATVYGWRGRFEPLPQLGHFLNDVAGNPIYLAVALTAAAGAVSAWRAPRLLPAVAWAALYVAGLLVSKVLLFRWYYVPLLPVYGILVVLGVLRAMEWARRSPAAAALADAARGTWSRVLVALLLVPTVGASVASAWVRARDAQDIEDRLRRPLGIWLRRHSLPTDRVMLEPIGYIGYYSQRPVLDPIGLVTPAVLPYWRPGSTYPFHDIAAAFRPEWCVLRPSEADRIIRVARESGRPWSDQYEQVADFSYAPDPSIAFRVYRRRAEARPGARR